MPFPVLFFSYPSPTYQQLLFKWTVSYCLPSPTPGLLDASKWKQLLPPENSHYWSLLVPYTPMACECDTSLVKYWMLIEDRSQWHHVSPTRRQLHTGRGLAKRWANRSFVHSLNYWLSSHQGTATTGGLKWCIRHSLCLYKVHYRWSRRHWQAMVLVWWALWQEEWQKIDTNCSLLDSERASQTKGYLSWVL